MGNKLPGIQYRTDVSSLGRHDVNDPARVANAQIAAAGEVVNAVENVEKIVATIEYTKHIGEAKTGIVDLYDQVTSKELFHIDDIPEYVDFNRFEKGLDDQGDVIDVEREFIPAIEVSEEWFKRGAKHLSQAITSNTLTGIARKRLDLEINGSIAPAAYGNLVAHNRAAEKLQRLAELDYAVQANVVAGDRIGAEATLTRFLSAGLISKEDYRIRQLKASQDLDIEAYSKGIAQAEGPWDVDEFEDELNLNRSITTPGDVESDLTYSQRQAIRSSINTRRVQFDKDRKELQTSTAQDLTARAVSDDLDYETIADAVREERLDHPTGRALNAMIESGRTSASSSIIRAEVVAEHKSVLQRWIYFPQFGIQATDMVQQSKSYLIRNDILNGAEKDVLLTYADKLEDSLRSTPEFNTAIKAIRAAVGLPEGQDAYDALTISFMTPTTKLSMKAAADFQQALFNYIDEFAGEANVLEFVERNKSNYDYQSKPDELDRRWTQLENSPYASYAPKAGIVTNINPDTVMKAAYDDYKSGKRSDEELFDVWNIVFGDAVDIPYLEGL